MGIVVEVGDQPLLHRVQSWLDQRNVREGVVVEHVDDGLGVVVAGLLVAESAGDRQRSLDRRCHHRRVDERRVRVQVLARFEGGGLSLAAGVRRGANQGLGREHEEPVGVADVLRIHVQGAEHRGRILRAVVGVQHTGIADRRRARIRRELEDQVALLGHRDRDREPRCGRDVERRAVTVDRPSDLRVRVAVLSDDGELRVIARRGLGQSDCHVGDVADVGHRPDLRLTRLDLQFRLELAVHGELHVALILRQCRVLGDLLGRAVEGDQVRRHELGLAAVVVRRQRALPPRRDVLGALGGLGRSSPGPGSVDRCRPRAANPRAASACSPTAAT